MTFPQGAEAAGKIDLAMSADAHSKYVLWVACRPFQADVPVCLRDGVGWGRSFRQSRKECRGHCRSKHIGRNSEAANLEATLSGIDKMILGMPIEETSAAAELVMALVPDKGKGIAEAASEEKGFDLRNLVG